MLGLPREKPERVLGVLLGTGLNMSQENVLVENTGRSPLDTRKCVFHCEGGQTLAQISQGGCGISILGDTEKTAEHDHE